MTTDDLIAAIRAATRKLTVCVPTNDFYARDADWSKEEIKFIDAELLMAALHECELRDREHSRYLDAGGLLDKEHYFAQPVKATLPDALAASDAMAAAKQPKPARTKRFDGRLASTKHGKASK